MAKISGLVRRSIIGGIGAISLSSFHAKSVVVSHPLRRDIVKAPCVAEVVTRRQERSRGGQFLHSADCSIDQQ